MLLSIKTFLLQMNNNIIKDQPIFNNAYELFLNHMKDKIKNIDIHNIDEIKMIFIYCYYIQVI